MAYIIKEKRNNHIYYYLAESARVDGKPRIVSKKYLGTAEDISDILNNNEKMPKPEYSKIFEFGAVLALYDIAERLNIRQIIEQLSDLYFLVHFKSSYRSIIHFVNVSRLIVL